MDTGFKGDPIEVSLEKALSHDIPGALRFHNDFLITSNLKDFDMSTHPIRLTATSIFICVGGELDFTVNLKEYHVTANHIMVTFAGDVVQVLRCQDIDGYAVLMSEEYLRSIQLDFRFRAAGFMNLRENVPIRVPREELQYLLPYYVLIKKNVQEENPEVIRGLSLALASQLIVIMRRYGIVTSDSSISATRAQQVFEKFMKLLRTYHVKEHGLQFYADKMFLTSKYVSGLVKQYTGKGALEWINDYVMLEARMMLKYTDLTIQEISYRLNFPTQSAFGKYFRQQEGVSPRAYRQGESGKKPAMAESVEGEEVVG